MTELPLTVVDASKGVAAEKFKEELDRGALTVKSVYWSALNITVCHTILFQFPIGFIYKISKTRH